MKAFNRFVIVLTAAAVATAGTAAPRQAAPKAKVAVKKSPVAASAYRPSRVAGVNVRFAPAPAPAGRRKALVEVAPGASRTRSLPGVARTRNRPVVKALKGGGYSAALDSSWQSASRAVVVNGKVQMVCTQAGHGTHPHYHDASGRHNLK